MHKHIQAQSRVPRRRLWPVWLAVWLAWPAVMIYTAFWPQTLPARTFAQGNPSVHPSPVDEVNRQTAAARPTSMPALPVQTPCAAVATTTLAAASLRSVDGIVTSAPMRWDEAAQPAPLEPSANGSPLEITGTVKPDELAAFKVHALAGQAMTVTLAAGPDDYLSVHGMDDHQPLLGVLAEAKGWNGTVSASQDYEVLVEGGASGKSRYALSVALGGPGGQDVPAVMPRSCGPSGDLEAPAQTRVLPAPSSKVVYLTFDDGPSETWTPAILEVLARYRAHATFFAIGRQALRLPDIIAAERRAGHSIGHHTFAHQKLVGLRGDALVAAVNGPHEQPSEQVSDRPRGHAPAHLVEDSPDPAPAHLVEDPPDRAPEHPIVDSPDHQPAAGPGCLRPPYGEGDAFAKAYAAELGLRWVKWDVDPYDWRQPGTEAIVTRIMEKVQPGAVVLMHDGGGNRSQTVAALEPVLAQLSSEGYAFAAMCSG